MADSPATAPPETFPQTFGRYTLVRRLGEGGMGDVYLASLKGGIEGVEKSCVIKKLKRTYSGDEEFVARFLDEARLSVQLSHGNIVPVFDAGTQDGDYYLAMEHVDGMDLKDLLDQQIRGNTLLPQPVAVYVAREILSALGYAHRKKDAQGRSLGLVHRDISPQNILLSLSGEVKLIDFGLAKSSQKVLKTNPNVVLGKYAYMSPEQARGQPIDGRSDLFAVALLLWEMLANRKLFDGVTVGELMEQIAEHRVFAVSKVTGSVDAELDALLNRALLKDVTQRFQTAEEFREGLGRILNRLAPNISADDLTREIKKAKGLPMTVIGPPPTRPAAAPPAPPPSTSAAGPPALHRPPQDEPTAGMDPAPKAAAKGAPGQASSTPRNSTSRNSAQRSPAPRNSASSAPMPDTELISRPQTRVPSSKEERRAGTGGSAGIPTWKLVAMGLGAGAAVALLGGLLWLAVKEEQPAPSGATPADAPADDAPSADAKAQAADNPAKPDPEPADAADGDKGDDEKKAASTAKKKSAPAKKKKKGK
jgi:serine/threonine protein kinase